MIIQAAVAGQGVALARLSLVAQDLAEHRLAPLFAERPLPIDWAYYAVASAQALARPPVAAFHDWLVKAWK